MKILPCPKLCLQKVIITLKLNQFDMKNLIDLFLIFERAFPFASYNDEHYVPISSSSDLILHEKSQCS